MTLHLTLKKKWFYMILRGEKIEEYREIKMYWWMRLVECGEWDERRMIMSRRYTTIEFKNGYAKNAPMMEVECRGIKIGTTKDEWCGEGEKETFVIQLGRVLFHKNCET